jgi:hypothetical protein
MTEPADETASSAVHRVAVRLPTFRPDRPAVWFAQAEVQFELAAITRQRTKFNYVVSQLNQQQAAEIEDIITSPPEHEPYDRLKAELVRRLSTSREQRVRQLLSHEEMDDRKPSQFLRHLTFQTIFFAPFGPAVYHHTYKRYLPVRLRAVLTQPPTSRTKFSRSLPSKHLPGDVRQHSRVTGAYRGAFRAFLPTPTQAVAFNVQCLIPCCGSLSGCFVLC